MSTNDYLQGITYLLGVVIFFLAVSTGALLGIAANLRRWQAQDRQRSGDRSPR